jgi:hypothetical protein
LADLPVEADAFENAGRRMVFVIARPLHGVVGCILSGSRLQQSHWAVIVCDNVWDADQIRALVSDLNENPQKRNDQLGMLFQLYRLGDGSLSTGLNFSPTITTRDFVEAFPRCLITFVGTTDLTKNEILQKGTDRRTNFAYMRLGDP